MGKKLRIAFLCRDFGTVHRGVETYVLELSKRLSINHEVTILSGVDAYSFLKMVKGGFDLIIPTNGRTQSLKASLGRIIGNYKTIVSGQSGIGKDDIWNITLTCPDIYVALTEAEFLWAKKWAWKSKVVKIPNGVNLGKFSPKGERVDLDLPKPVVLSVGVLDWYKHHERVIEAMNKVEKGSLLIIGVGPEKEKLLNLGKKLLDKGRLKIISTSFEEMPKYYRSADLFTLPSWDREAFGIVYIEAMASGLPVVAPNDLVRREIVGNAGILVNTENSDQYAKVIITALNKKWENIPRQQAEKFSWDKIVNQYENLFEEMFK
ncbi:MAG: glycosyltransferase family 4 protein [Candidatus Daviesbacteria bacterium]|nr:glycosyltransferase family 4 protein [Candidatus Daviesbacteria bacterium]